MLHFNSTKELKSILLSLKSPLIRSSSLHPPKSWLEQTGRKLTELNEMKAEEWSAQHIGAGASPPPPDAKQAAGTLLSSFWVISSWSSLTLCCWICLFCKPALITACNLLGFLLIPSSLQHVLPRSDYTQPCLWQTCFSYKTNYVHFLVY